MGPVAQLGTPAEMAGSQSAALAMLSPPAAAAAAEAEHMASAGRHTLSPSPTAASATPQRDVSAATSHLLGDTQPSQPQTQAGPGPFGSMQPVGAQAEAASAPDLGDPRGNRQPAHEQLEAVQGASGSVQLQLQLAEAQAEAARARADVHRLEMEVGSLQVRLRLSGRVSVASLHRHTVTDDLSTTLKWCPIMIADQQSSPGTETKMTWHT